MAAESIGGFGVYNGSLVARTNPSDKLVLNQLRWDFNGGDPQLNWVGSNRASGFDILNVKKVSLAYDSLQERAVTALKIGREGLARLGHHDVGDRAARESIRVIVGDAIQRIRAGGVPLPVDHLAIA